MAELNGKGENQQNAFISKALEEHTELVCPLLRPKTSNSVNVIPRFPTKPEDFHSESQDLMRGKHESQDTEEREATSDKSNKHIFPQVIAALTVSIASMMVGFSSGYTSPALPSMESSSLNITKIEKSWIGSLIPLSAIAGSLVGGYLSEVFGRKMTILICGPPMLAGSLLIGSAVYVWMIYLGRALIGGCVGVLNLCFPIYLAETSQAEIRGVLGLLPTTFGNGGILVCYTIGAFVDWSMLAYIGGLIPLTFTVMTFFIPETPRWLLNKGRPDDAKKSLRWLRGPDLNIDKELSDIAANINNEGGRKSTVRDIFRARFIRPMLISLSLMIFQQLSGINAVIFYAEDIFKEAGSQLNKNICSIIIGVVNIISIFFANVLIDKLGRKILLIISSIVSLMSLLALGSFFYIKENLITSNNLEENEFWSDWLQKLSWLPLASLVFYVFSFSLGWGPLPWLFMGEGLPNKIRGPGGSLATLTNWTAAFIVTKTFQGMLEQIGAFGVFTMFSGIMFLALIFIVLIFPETKGKEIEEIEEILAKPCCGYS